MKKSVIFMAVMLSFSILLMGCGNGGEAKQAPQQQANPGNCPPPRWCVCLDTFDSIQAGYGGWKETVTNSEQEAGARMNYRSNIDSYRANCGNAGHCYQETTNLAGQLEFSVCCGGCSPG